jgi:hypothetical protein
VALAAAAMVEVGLMAGVNNGIKWLENTFFGIK